MKKAVRLATIMLGLVAAGLLGWRVAMFRSAPSNASTSYGRVTDFSFTDQQGQPFGLNDLKGRVWIADFIFTRCLGPCPLLTTRMSELHNEFASKKDLLFVSFSVDPEYDSPAVLDVYAKRYGADAERWRFLTGPKDQLYRLVRESFHLAVEQEKGQTPSMTDILHSLYFVVIDKKGNVVGYFDSADAGAMASLRSKIKSL